MCDTFINEKRKINIMKQEQSNNFFNAILNHFNERNNPEEKENSRSKEKSFKLFDKEKLKKIAQKKFQDPTFLDKKDIEQVKEMIHLLFASTQKEFCNDLYAELEKITFVDGNQKNTFEIALKNFSDEVYPIKKDIYDGLDKIMESLSLSMENKVYIDYLLSQENRDRLISLSGKYIELMGKEINSQKGVFSADDLLPRYIDMLKTYQKDREFDQAKIELVSKNILSLQAIINFLPGLANGEFSYILNTLSIAFNIVNNIDMKKEIQKIDNEINVYQVNLINQINELNKISHEYKFSLLNTIYKSLNKEGQDKMRQEGKKCYKTDDVLLTLINEEKALFSKAKTQKAVEKYKAVVAMIDTLKSDVQSPSVLVLQEKIENFKKAYHENKEKLMNHRDNRAKIFIKRVAGVLLAPVYVIPKFGANILDKLFISRGHKAVHNISQVLKSDKKKPSKPI